MSRIIMNEDFDDEFMSDETTYDTDRYEEIKSKEVVDADGFTTDYTMYFDKDEQKYIFMFGDKEVSTPADEYADWMSEDEEIANSWFDHYVGFNEDEVEEVDEEYFDESLTEDTVKQGGKWVNKGKEGTHGKFKTKKEADAQRRAMFAQGYKEELEEDFDDDEVDVTISFEDKYEDEDFDDIDEIQITDLDEDCSEKKPFSALEDVRSTLSKQVQEKVEEPKSSADEMLKVDECEDCEDLDDLN